MNEKIFEMFPILESERVVIKQMQKTDIDVIYDFNSCKESLKYIARNPYKTIKEAEEKLSFHLSRNEDKTAFWWTFTLKSTDEKIGYGGLFDISTTNNKAEIGYGLIKKHWGKGYMSEIMNEILRFGVSIAEFHKIYGIIIPGNEASIRLLEKNGFVKEAHLRDHSYARGQYFDEAIYSLINQYSS